jgi:hypothetical protein
MRRITLVWLVLIFAGAAPLAGCKSLVLQQAILGPQSHFAFPNSDVKDLGPVRVVVTKPATLDFPEFTSEDDLKLYNTALAQVEGANIILDYCKIVRWYTILVWPYPPIFKIQIETELQGRAAKMEVGEHMPTPKT